MRVAFVIAISVLLGLLLFLYSEVRRPPGPATWGRAPRWPKRLRVAFAAIVLLLSGMVFWGFLIEPGRLVVRPWAHRTMSPLSGLGLALAGSHGTQPDLLPTFRTSGQQTYFTYVSGAVGDGARFRVSPQAFYYHGPFGGYAEYVRSSGQVRHDIVAVDLAHVAWQVAASWMLTGEAATDHGVRPRANFDPAHHSWGAFQIGARYHQLTVDRAAVTLGLTPPSSSRSARAWTGGATWYPNSFVKWLFNVERTVFDAGSSVPRPPENLIVFRAQLAF